MITTSNVTTFIAGATAAAIPVLLIEHQVGSICKGYRAMHLTHIVDLNLNKSSFYQVFIAWP